MVVAVDADRSRHGALVEEEDTDQDVYWAMLPKDQHAHNLHC